MITLLYYYITSLFNYFIIKILIQTKKTPTYRLSTILVLLFTIYVHNNQQSVQKHNLKK